MSIIKAKIIGSNVNYETYSRQDPDVTRGNPAFSMSRGELTNFFVNPKRWLDGYKADQEETKSTQWGSVLDCLLTAPSEFQLRYAVPAQTYFSQKMKCPSCGSVTDSQKCAKCKCAREPVTIEKPWDSKAGACAEWEESQGEKAIIKHEIYEDALKAVASMEANPVTHELFEVSDNQVMVLGFWKDEDTGLEVPIRCLIDALPPVDHPQFGKWIVDSKTARDGNPSKWDGVVAKEGYDVQAALIMDLYTSATGEDRTDFIHVVQENVFPFHVTDPLMAMTSEFLGWGRAKYQAALRLYCKCLATGEWPSFAPVGIRYGLTQMIGPDNLFIYRQSGGMVGVGPMIAPPEPKPEDQRFDIAN